MKKLTIFLVFFGYLLFFVQNAFSMPPYPGLAQISQTSPGLDSSVLKAPVIGTKKFIILMIEFADIKANYTTSIPSFYNFILFDPSNDYNLHAYYKEVSYGKINVTSGLIPQGWFVASENASYYSNANYGLGGYPNNSQGLAEEAITQFNNRNPGFDYSPYDNDGDKIVDAFIVIHAGSSADFTGSVNDIWSHKWNLPESAVVDLGNGFKAKDYIMVPEYMQTGGDSTIGVFAHELGHVFGLQDLYPGPGRTGTDVGVWSLMAEGAWNGYRGDRPSHPDAWSKMLLGWLPVSTLTQNAKCTISPLETQDPTDRQAYTLRINEAVTNEFFVVENRQNVGFDQALPDSGLLIYHVHMMSDNIRADTMVLLGRSSWKQTYFGHITTPSSDSYSGEKTYVAISQIKKSDPGNPSDILYRNIEAELCPILLEPRAPSDFGANGFAGSGSVFLYWNDNSSWPTDEEDGFVIDRKTVGVTDWITVDTTERGDETFTDFGSYDVTATYSYRIKAMNATGYSEYQFTQFPENSSESGGGGGGGGAVGPLAVGISALMGWWKRKRQKRR